MNLMQALIVSCYVMPNQDLALVLSTFYVSLGQLVIGFPIPFKNLTGILHAASYITSNRYFLQILVRQQFKGTSREVLLESFDMVVPTQLNFLAMLLIYFGLLVATYAALVCLAARVRK